MRKKWRSALALLLVVATIFTTISFDSVAEENVDSNVNLELTNDASKETQVEITQDEESTADSASSTSDEGEEATTGTEEETENPEPGTIEETGNPEEGTGEAAENPEPGTEEETENPEPGTGEEIENPEEGTGEAAENPEPGTEEETENPGEGAGEAAENPEETAKNLGEGFEGEPSVSDELNGYMDDLEEQMVGDSAEDEIMLLAEKANENPTVTAISQSPLLVNYPFQITWARGDCEAINLGTVDQSKVKYPYNDYKGVSLNNISKSKGQDYYGMRYNNVGIYNGKVVDLLVTVRDWDPNDYFTGTNSKPAVLFSNQALKFYMKDISSVKFRFQFYEHGTNTPVAIKGIFNFVDIDGYQSIAFKPDDFSGEKAYILGSGYLQQGEGKGWNYVEFNRKKYSAVKVDADNKNAWVTTTFGGTGGKSGFILRFQDKKANREGGKEFVMFGLGASSLVTSPLEPPVKTCDKVTTGNAFDVSAFTYTIAQKMPGRAEGDLVSEYILTDVLDRCLHVQANSADNITITDSSGRNVKDRFNVKLSQDNNEVWTVTISAKDNQMLKSDFYGTIYYFGIPVKIKAGANLYAHAHVNTSTHMFSISNQAKVMYSTMTNYAETELWTNKVTITRKLPSCTFVKVDSETGNAITNNPATFTIYSDNECTQYVGTATDTPSTGVYTIPVEVWGTIAVNNDRYYYMKETSSPDKYQENNNKYTIKVQKENGGIVISGGNYSNGKIPNTAEKELTITKTGSEPRKVKKGDSIQYTITVTNPNKDKSYSASVTDVLNSKLTAGSYMIDGTSKGTWTGSVQITVPANGKTTIRINATVNAVYNINYINADTETNRNSNIISNTANMSYTYQGKTKTVSTGTVYHYLYPRLDYTLTKVRSTSVPSGRNGWGFLPTDGYIVYYATVQNTYGDIPLNVALTDRFSESSYFSFSGSSEQRLQNVMKPTTLTFRAKVNEGTPGTLGEGYQNTVTATVVTATYRNPETGKLEEINGAAGKTAVAYTPVAPILYKYDSATGQPITGITDTGSQPVFRLYKNAECTSYSSDFTYCSYDSKTGAVYLPNAAYVSAGTYYLKEVSAPSKYNLSDTVYTVYIADNGQVTVTGTGGSFDGKIYNKPETEPKIVKTTTTSEYVKKNGMIYYNLTVSNENNYDYEVTVTDILDSKLRAHSYYYVDEVYKSGSWPGSVKITIPENGSVVIRIPAVVNADYSTDYIDSVTAENRNKNIIRNAASMTYTFQGKEKTVRTPEVLHYLQPTVSYTVTKTRTTKAFSETWGFVPGDGTKINYSVEVKNSGTVPIDVTLTDAYLSDAASYFTFSGSSRTTIEWLDAGGKEEKVFTATVNENAPAKISMGVSSKGYQNKVTASAVGKYRDAKTGNMAETSAVSKTAFEYTPVAPVIHKYDENTKQPITEEPTFQVFKNASCTGVGTKCGYDARTGQIILPPLNSFTSDSSSYTGYLKETEAPPNYSLHGAVYKIAVSKSDGSVKITHASSGSSFDGVIYNVRSDSGLVIEKTGSSPQVVHEGDTITYTITVKNRTMLNYGQGRDVIGNIKDPIPDGLEVIDSGEGSVQNGVWWYWGTFYNNQIRTFKIRAKVLRGYDNTGIAEEKAEKNTFRNQALLSYSGTQGNVSVYSQIVEHYLEPEINFTITKKRVTSNPSGRNNWGFIYEDGNIEYAVTLKNTGELPLTIDVKDVFDTEGVFEFVGASRQQVSVAVGEEKTVTFYARVREDAPGAMESYWNTATAYASGKYIDPRDGSTRTLTMEKSARAQTRVAPYFYKYDSLSDTAITETDTTPPVFTVYKDSACKVPIYEGFSDTIYDSQTGRMFLPIYYGWYSAGTYYMKETQTPSGYVSSGEVYKITVSGSKNTVEITGLDGNDIHHRIDNDPLVPTITKTSDTDGQYVKYGDTITYTLTITNPGSRMQYVTVEDIPDPKLTKISVEEWPNSNQFGFYLGGKETKVLTLSAVVRGGFNSDYKYDAAGNAAANTIINTASLTYYYGGRYHTITTDEVRHYLKPRISYYLKKERRTEPPNGQGFLPGDGTEISYEVALTNTGDIPIDAELTDVYDEEGKFTFIGSDQASLLEISPWETNRATFTASVNEGTEGNLTGYRNTVTASVKGEYRDPKTGNLITLTAEPETATALTPVLPTLYKYDSMTGLILVAKEGDDPEFTVYTDPECSSEYGKCSYDRATGRIELPIDAGIFNYLGKTLYLRETRTPESYYEDASVYEIVIGKDGSVVFFREGQTTDRIYNQPKNYDVTITKEGSLPVYVRKGDTITYTLTVTNPYNVSVDVKVTDVLDEEKLRAGAWSLDDTEQDGNWSGSCEMTVRANTACMIVIEAEVLCGYDDTAEDRQEANTIANQAVLDVRRSDESYETKESNIVKHYLVPAADLTVTKTRITEVPERIGSSLGFIREDGEIRYDAVITNTGELPLKLNVEDAFEEDGIFEFVGSSMQSDIFLPAGESVTVRFAAQVAVGAPGSWEPYRNTATVKATAVYIDAQDGTERTLYVEAEDSAETPVASYFLKTDSATGEALTGVEGGPEFTIYPDEDCETPVAFDESAEGCVYDRVTGRVYLPGGDYFTYASGVYYIKETLAPDGYEESDEVYRLVINEKGQYESITDLKGNDRNWSISNVKKGDCSFGFTKVDANDMDETLTGAYFQLYQMYCTDPSHNHDEEIIDTDNPGACWIPVGEAQISDPTVRYDSLQWEGVYQLAEVAVPDGYTRPRGQWRLTFDKDKKPVLRGISDENWQPMAFVEDEESGGLLLPNLKEADLPESGGPGTFAWTFGGILMMAAALLLQLLTGRKRKTSM